MAVDENCKKQFIKIIKNKLSMARLVFGDGTKTMAMNMLQQFINTIPDDEYNLTLSDYLSIHPEVRNQYPQAVSSLPQCAYKYTMQELVDYLYEIKL